MAYGYGRCTNFDYCSIADSRKDVAAPTGDAFLCPECRKPLKVPERIKGGSVAMVAGLAFVIVAASATGAYVMLRPASGNSPATGASAAAGHSTIAAIAPAHDIAWNSAVTMSRPTAPATARTMMQPQAKPLAHQALAEAAPAPVAPQPENVVLRLSGSNTIGAVLGPKLAQRFLIDAGDADVAIAPGKDPDEVRVVGSRGGKTEIITVAAHGSATAFTDLGKNAADIGMASRRIKPAENSALAALGDMTAPGNEHVLALDGIAVVVSPNNTIPTMTLDQLKGVFSGQIANWSQLGQPAGEIHIYARDDKSGTFDTFKALVLGSNVKLSPAAKRIEDSRELSGDVAQDRNGIGFIGLPYILSARAVPVAETGASPLLPNRLTVGTEDYALARRLFLYTPAASQNPLVRRFVEFALSAPGQTIAEDTGFVPLTITPAAAPVPQTASTKYRSLVAQATRLSTNFRFLPNSAALDNRGQRDLDRLVNFVVSTHAAPSQIILVGFADNQGSPTVNQAVSRKRAEAVAAGLAERGLKVAHVAAFGADLPVADNVTDTGREKNRRVEVFMRL